MTNKYKITNTIYTVTTYDRAGKLDVFTNIRYLDYIVMAARKSEVRKETQD